MRTLPALSALATALVLTACGGDADSGPKVSVDELAAGRYTVAAGSAEAPAAGRYLAADDGTRLLVIDDADGRATALYRREAGGRWHAVPEPADDITVTLQGSQAEPAEALTLAALAGRYTVRLVSGEAAAFTLAADGTITADAGVGSCRLSGTVSAGRLPGTLGLVLRTSGCGTLAASSTGVLTRGRDDAPAAFRLLAEDGRAIVDLLAYAE